MGARHRLALSDDASRLYDVRRRSILELAPPIMPAEEAETWATQLTPPGMARKLLELEIWIAELDGMMAGWGAIRGEHLEGLYTPPNSPAGALVQNYSVCWKG